jgi:hypothetical protein
MFTIQRQPPAASPVQLHIFNLDTGHVSYQL